MMLRLSGHHTCEPAAVSRHSAIQQSPDRAACVRTLGRDLRSWIDPATMHMVWQATFPPKQVYDSRYVRMRKNSQRCRQGNMLGVLYKSDLQLRLGCHLIEYLQCTLSSDPVAALALAMLSCVWCLHSHADKQRCTLGTLCYDMCWDMSVM